jgi:sec-independent protein translocase protein TatB
MFDLGGGELLVIGIIALIVIGPKELPGLLRTIGQALGKLRRMAADFQGQFSDAMKEADLGETQKILTDLHSTVRSKFDISKIAETQPSLTEDTKPSSPLEATSEAKEVIDQNATLSLDSGTLSDLSEPVPLIVSEVAGTDAVEEKKTAPRKKRASKVADASTIAVEENN